MGSSQSKKLAALAKGKQPSKSHEKRASVPELGRDGGWKMQGRKAGAGATASVRVIYREGHPKKYAVKMFLRRYKETSSEYRKRVGREFDIAVRLQHENLLRTFHQGQKKGTLYFVMEYCGAGDLFDLIQKGGLRWEHKKRLLKQLLRGMKYLHDHGIAHRDIKPENIVMADPNCLKICDFGDAVVFRETDASHPPSAEDDGTERIQLYSSRALGTKGYHPPEFAGEEPYDPRHLDVWCVGLTCLFLFVEGYAWDLADPEEDTFYDFFDAGWRAFRLIHQDRIPTDADYPICEGCFRCLEDAEPGLRTLIFRMVDPNPATRITIDDALNSPWVQGIEC